MLELLACSEIDELPKQEEPTIVVALRIWHALQQVTGAIRQVIFAVVGAVERCLQFGERTALADRGDGLSFVKRLKQRARAFNASVQRGQTTVHCDDA